MEYNNFLSLRIKKEELGTLKKAIWLYNQENEYQLKISEKREHSSVKDIFFVDIHFHSKVYHIGFETSYVLFDLGKYYRDVEVLY